jgi:hypothetical protein
MTTATMTNTPFPFRNIHTAATHSVILGDGVSFVETFSNGNVRLVSPRNIPMVAVNRYQRAAMELAQVTQLEDGAFYAHVPGLRGAWANEATPWASLRALEEVIRDWIIVKISCGDRDFPVIEGIDLNVL